jgi:hypothetical protein
MGTTSSTGLFVRELSTLHTEYIYVPHTILRINNDYFLNSIERLDYVMEKQPVLSQVGAKYLSIVQK